MRHIDGGVQDTCFEFDNKIKYATSKLLGLLTKHHDFNLPYIKPEPKPASKPVVIKIAEPVCVDVPVYALPETERKLTIEGIKRVVCREFGLSHSVLVSDRRHGPTVYARQVAMYLCKEHTPFSLPAIGRRFGNRDHTTILHGVNKIAALRSSSPTVDGLLSNLEAQL